MIKNIWLLVTTFLLVDKLGVAWAPIPLVTDVLLSYLSGFFGAMYNDWKAGRS